MDLRRKLYTQGIAAVIVSILACLLVDVCCNYTESFEEIAASTELYAS